MIFNIELNQREIYLITQALKDKMSKDSKYGNMRNEVIKEEQQLLDSIKNQISKEI